MRLFRPPLAPPNLGGEVITLFRSEGTDDEGEAALLTVDEIVGQRPSSPRVDTAESHLALLDVNLRERTLDEVA